MTAYCQLRNVRTVFNNEIELKESAKDELTVSLNRGATFVTKTQLFGEFARENIRTALCLAEMVLADNDKRLAVYQRALGNHVNPGRLSVIKGSPTILLDSAHTDESYQLLFTSLKQRYPDKRPVFLVGISAGRDQAKLIDGLQQLAYSCSQASSQ